MSSSSSSSTSITLLAALVDPRNRKAWERFDRRYRPLIVRFAQQLGLSRHDAGEVAQQTTVSFYEAHQRGQYDPKRGRFQNWLLGIARHKVADFCAECARQPTPASQRTQMELAVRQLGDPQSVSLVWERQWQAHVLSICLKRARRDFPERDVRVFELFALEGKTADDVAEAMSLPKNHVHVIKHRVLGYIQGVKARIEHEG